jgi:hypothetical protein
MKIYKIKTTMALGLSLFVSQAFAGELYLRGGENALIRASDATRVYCSIDPEHDSCKPEDSTLAVRIYQECRATLSSPEECAKLVKRKFPRGASCANFASVCYDDCRSGLDSVEECTNLCF